VGKPIPKVDVCITDDKGEPLPPEQVGELCVRAGSIMIGYYKQPKETEETLVDGWLRTGDIAKIDEDGYVYILERKKELIIYKGMNVYPTEIEAVLLQRPEIAEAAVVGAYDSVHGEVPEAFVVFHAGQSVSESELRALCRENLAAYKAPRRYHFTDQLPKTSTGKIKKSELRAGLVSRG
jgi:long-chain acyl-CoA synthetase